jgi:probable LLM family oxidoreductase
MSNLWTNPDEIEFGVDTALNTTVDENGDDVPGDQVVRNTIEEGVLADSVGIDTFNVAEHYRAGFMDSAGAVVLAAIGARTTRIQLGTAVTVLSTQDPVRLFTQFSTLDAISNGRAQITLGRGSLTDSFPLFGLDLADYEELFDEKLDLFMKLRHDQPVTWSGKFRSSLHEQFVYPPLPAGHLPTWIGVGGSPQSVIRAARYGLPVVFAIIGGDPMRYAPLIELHGRALEQFGQSPQPVGMHAHGFIAETDKEAADTQIPFSMKLWGSDDRRPAPPRAWFDNEITEGAQFIGSVETVAAKIAKYVRALGLGRFQLVYSVGATPHEKKMETLERYGREVIPMVREMLRADANALPARSS